MRLVKPPDERLDLKDVIVDAAHAVCLHIVTRDDATQQSCEEVIKEFVNRAFVMGLTAHDDEEEDPDEL